VTTSTIADGRGEENRRHETMSIRSPIRAGTRRLRDGDEVEGQALVEYSLIFVLIVIVCFAIVGSVASTIDEKFFQIVQAMP
jgi:Flp pilus assembly pilin Flp